MANDGAVAANTQKQPLEKFYEQDIDFMSLLDPTQMPGIISLAAAMNGYLPPQHNNDFTYVDLGCGPGKNVLSLASMLPHATFIGVDFNENHMKSGQEEAKKLGLKNVTFLHKSFDDIQPGDLPEDCDFVTCRGCYAWLEDELAISVRKLISQILKPGGLAMVEFLCLPGKVSVDPMWKLIQDLVPSEDFENSYERAKAGYQLLDTISRRGMRYLNAHATVANSVQNYLGVAEDAREAKIKHFSHNALASGFSPRYFKDMYHEMKEFELTYAGSAVLALNDLELSVPNLQISTFKDIGDDICKSETLKDFIRNEQERFGVFVYKGEKNETAANDYIDTHLRLTRKSNAQTIQRWIGNGFNQKIPLTGASYDTVISQIADKTVSLKDITKESDIDISELRQAALRLLISGEFIDVGETPCDCPDDLSSITSFEMPHAFNRFNIENASKGKLNSALISDRSLLSLIRLNVIETMVLAEAVKRECTPDEAIKAVRARLVDTKEKFMTKSGARMGKQITPDDIRAIYDDFVEDTLPALIRLGILKVTTE